MADKINKIAPTGNMDKDSDVRYVGKGERAGDTVENRNTQIASDSGSSAGDITPTLGNELAFNLGAVSAQNKKYTVTVDGDVTKSHAIKFLSTKRDARLTTGTAADGSVEFNGTVASLTAAFISTNLASAFTVTSSGNTVTFELTNGYNYYQWYLENTGTDDVLITCIQEAIPINLAGNLKDIGSYDLLGDLFICSTSQDNLPVETTLVVQTVGLGGPLTPVTFTTPHGLLAGQWIRITNSEAPWLNGLFVIVSVTATQINIVTDAAWGATHSAFTIGSETVTIDPVGIGEIGVAQRDDNTDTWTYIRLLRSVELNFVSKKAIDLESEPNIKRKAIYGEDDYNPSIAFYYYGEYIEDGALSFNNPLNFYAHDKISRQVFANKTKPTVKISFKEQLQSGGNTPSGNLRYFVILKNKFGNWTKPSDLTNIVITYSDEASGKALGDSESTTNTNKVNVLTVSEIDTDIYSSIRLGYYALIEGTYSAKIMGEEEIESSSQDIKHDGFCEEELYDVGELASNFITGYDYAKSNKIIDNRLVRSNLRKKQLKDFTDWAKSFKHRIKEKFIIASTFESNAEEYQSALNGFENLGYMFNESYRYGVRGEFIDTGELTPWFWVDDIKIDPFPTNEYNPNDNRRDQTGSDIVTNFDLTKNIGGPFPSNRWVKVPYVEFFDVDVNYNIDGVPLSSLIKNIEFGRAEVVPEVLCTGIATNSVLFQGIRNVFYNKLNGNSPFTPDDGGRAACFPFSKVPSGQDFFMKYLIQVPSSDDISQIRFEYPFVYGPPFVADNSLNNAYPDVAADNSIPIYEYPTDSDVFFGTNVLIQNDPAVVSFQPWKSDRTILSLYSPDVITGKITDISGYSILDFGEMFLGIDEPFFNRTAANIGAMYSQYSKYFPENFLDTFNTYDIDDWKLLEAGEKDFISNGKTFQKGFGIANRRLPSQDMIAVDNSHKNIRGPVIHVDNNGLGIVQQGKNLDYGVRYVQLYKQSLNKYCSKESTKYYTTGNTYSLSESVGSSGTIEKGVLNVFGGDTFTQLTYLKGRYIDFSALEAAGLTSWADAQFGPLETAGFGGGMKFYSQNRVNSQMRSDSNEQIVYLGDGTNPINPWLEEGLGKNDNFEYSSKYTPEFPSELGQPSYLELVKDPVDHPQRVEYSSRKTYSEEEDSYTDRPPLNIYDTNLAFGEINHHEDVQGELFLLQERKFTITSFNARGQLQTTENSVDVLLKSGDVFTTDGKTLSSYGTEHKWSAIKGFNPNGKDTLYWFNVENGVVMRFGEDGTRVISDRGMRAFFSNYTKWLRNKDEHAFLEGIRGVWDDERKEAIWTVTAWRNVTQWQPTTSFPFTQALVGSVVRNDNAPSDTYENFPMFFRCIQAHVTSADKEPAVGQYWEEYWEQIPYTDYNYYSIYTVCFNEMTNGFRCFYGHLPKTYLKWGKTFLSSHPTQRNLIFEHRKGQPTTWYGVPNFSGGAIAPKIEDAYFESVINELPEQSVRGVAVGYLTERVPDRVEYRTQRQYTFDEETQFEQRDDAFFAPIRNDATATGNPDSDDGMLSGSYLRVKFIIFGGTYNLLHSIVVKIRDRIRRINT